MYKYLTAILLLPLFLNSSVLAEILIINVESASNNGLALVGIYDKEENFGKAKVNKKLNTEKILTGAATEISNNKAQIKLDVPFGSYVVSGFQDFDGNGVISGNFLGIPKEPFGFSNDAKGRFGPPKWQDAVFVFNKSNQKITLRLKNYNNQ